MEISSVKGIKRKDHFLTISKISDITKKKKMCVYDVKQKRRLSCDLGYENRRRLGNKKKGRHQHAFSEQIKRKIQLRLERYGCNIDPRFKVVKHFVKQTQMYIQKLYKDYKRKYQLKNNNNLNRLYEQYMNNNEENDDNLIENNLDNKEDIMSIDNEHIIRKTICSMSGIEYCAFNNALYYRNKAISSYDNVIKENNVNQFTVLSSSNAKNNQGRRFEINTINYERNPNEDLLLKINTLIEEKLHHLKERESDLQMKIQEKDNEIAQLTLKYETSITQISNIQKEASCGLNTITNMNQYIQELRNNIKVYCRVKPDDNSSNKKCIYYPEIFDLNMNHNQGLLNTIELRHNETNVSAYYTFDRIFREDIDQSLIFNSLKPSMNKILEGENISFVLIGQTHSGKSYTLKGEERNKTQPDDNDNNTNGNNRQNKNEGIIQRGYMHITQEAKKQGIEIKISLLIVIIINDQIYELYHDKKGDEYFKSLLSNTANNQSEKWTIITSKDTLNQYITYADDLKLFQEGKQSECHIIYQLKIEHCDKRHSDSLVSFIETSGSECLLYPKDSPYYYNTKALKAVGKILSMLIDKKSNKTQIPYKETKLTQALRNLIKTNLKIIVLITIPKEDNNYNKTNELMRYSARSMLCY